MSDVNFTFKGSKQLADKLKSLEKEAKRKSKAAVLNESYAIMEDSRENYVPVDMGDLKASGRVEQNVRGNNISVSLVYGDEKTDPYALAVHEHPSEFSPPSWQGVEVKFSPTGHGPKYLERPVKAAVKGMRERLAEDMKLDGGG
jgi:hypothetical protein